ncbi:MAG: hypothetical protein AAFR95_07930 [Bacteroidota bacterium]
MHVASEAQMNEGAGLDVGQVLRGLGAYAYGRSEDLVGTTNQSRNQLCVVCDEDEPRVMVAAFLLSRALPILNAYPA